MAKILNLFKKIKYLAVPLIGVGIFYFITFILGSNTRCFFRNIFGIPCPGCGLSRAYTELFQGNVKGAFYYHPLFFIIPIIVIVIVFKNINFFKRLYKNNSFWNSILIAFLALWIIRMLLFFPKVEPMVFYKDSFLGRILNFILK